MEELSEAEEAVGVTDEALSTVASHSAIAGLCPLIPIPFVDDLIIERIHRNMVHNLCKQHDFYLSPAYVKLLTESPSSFLSGALKSVLLYPVKKLIRKVVYVLAIKSCADVASVVFHEGWLLARAFEQDYVDKQAIAHGDRDAIRALRKAICEARDHVDPSPTTQVMHSAFGVGKEVFDAILTAMKGVLTSNDDEASRLDAAQKEAAPIADRIQAEIRQHWANGDALDAALRTALDDQKQST